MSNIRRILYVQPYLFFCFSPQICTEPFIRISNYLNSRKDELNEDIQEEYLDLRLEILPDYWPENIDVYRESLKNKLIDIYKRFNFDIVAISCYSDFAYLNTIEIANMIKHFINPSCYIVVGGVHPSIFPNTFDVDNIPLEFNTYYPENETPIDYIIIDEGEKSFFNFIKSILNSSIKTRANLRENPLILEKAFLDSLDEIPPLNLELFRKYKKQIKAVGNFYTRFIRGCKFKCKFCMPSEDYTKSCKTLKFRSIKKCIEDLDVIINTKWLKFRQLHIVDPMFFPKRSLRNKFFEELEKRSDKINFGINIFDRIESCDFKDLDNYKKYNITPGLGLESVSAKLLLRIGKKCGASDKQANLGVKSYLDKTIELIKYSNKNKILIVFFYMLGIPGTDEQTLKERWDYFFKENNRVDALIKQYNINLEFFIYAIFSGNFLYNYGEKNFRAQYYYKKWWKIFDKNQAAFAATIKPSKCLSVPRNINKTREFIRNVFKYQMRLGNPFYTYRKLKQYGDNYKEIQRIYENFIKSPDNEILSSCCIHQNNSN